MDVWPRDRIYSLMKWVWLLAVLIGLAVYVSRNWSGLTVGLLQMPIRYLCGSLALVCCARLLLMENMRRSLVYVGVKWPYRQCLTVYTITQMAKYLPGGIWYLVGKAGAYRNAGMHVGQVRDAMIIEIIWTLGGALVFGLGCMSVAGDAFSWAGITAHRMVLPVVIALSVAGGGCLLCWLRRECVAVKNGQGSLGKNVQALAIQLAVWTCMGWSFGLLALPYLWGPPVMPYLFGLFAIAYIVGFVVPFAPAGIGVREGVFVLGLSAFCAHEDIVVLAALSRFMFLMSEVMCLPVAVLVNRTQGQKQVV